MRRIVCEFGDRSGVLMDHPPLDQSAECMHERAALGQCVVAEIDVGLRCRVADIGDDRREQHLLAAGEQDRTEEGQIGVVPG